LAEDPNKTPVTIPENWHQALPEELRADPHVAKHKGIEELARAHVNAQKLIGANKIAIPGENASEADWAGVWDALGRPKTAADYALKDPEKLPEGFAVDGKLRDAFRTKAHALGLLPRQVEGLYRWFLEQQAGEFTAMVETAANGRREGDAMLRKAWGGAYDAKVANALRVITQVGGAELMAALERSGLGNDPTMIKFMAAIGEKLGEGSADAGGGGSRPGDALTPDQALATIAELNLSPEHLKAKLDRGHPGHAAAVAREKALYEQAYPRSAA
jgi:hypothetical protein